MRARSSRVTLPSSPSRAPLGRLGTCTAFLASSVPLVELNHFCLAPIFTPHCSVEQAPRGCLPSQQRHEAQPVPVDPVFAMVKVPFTSDILSILLASRPACALRRGSFSRGLRFLGYFPRTDIYVLLHLFRQVE